MKMTFKVPEWINENFFEKILGASRGDKNVKILSFDITSLDNSQEHYASTIFKATVKYANKLKCEEMMKMLIKLVVPKANAFLDENSFETELNMYLSTLPDMQRVWCQSGENVEFAPKLLFSTKDPVPLLVFEDVSSNGYGMSSGPLKLQDTKIVTSKLAKFHAASINGERDVMTQTYHTQAYSFSNFKGKQVSCYKNGLFNLKARDGINFMRNNMHLFIDELKTWGGYEECVVKMQNMAKNFEKLGEKVYQANSSGDGINVLNHGDFHFNNMLFKKNEDGEICDVLFIDYQMTKWGSPSIDLLYLLYMVAARDVLDGHRDEIIRFYYNELVASLKAIGFMSNPPNILDLHAELLKNGFMEVLIAVCFMPFLFMDGNVHNAGVAFENGIEGIELRKSLYQLPEYKQFITKLLPKFLHQGLLL